MEVLQKKYDELTKGSVHWSTWRTTEKTALEKEIDTLKAEIHNLETGLETFSYPPHLGVGVIILMYLALFSIVLPVYLILTETFALMWKSLLFIMFTVGLLALFAYIGAQVDELRRK